MKKPLISLFHPIPKDSCLSNGNKKRESENANDPSREMEQKNGENSAFLPLIISSEESGIR
jgi:hypothetical protein